MKKEIIFGMLLIVLVVVSIFFVINYSNDEEHIHSEEHLHSVEIEGKDMRSLAVREIANLWEIDSEILLSEIITEFELKGNYTIDTILEDIREEYAFSPALIKDMAEEIKQQNIQNE